MKKVNEAIRSINKIKKDNTQSHRIEANKTVLNGTWQGLLNIAIVKDIGVHPTTE